MNVAWKLVEENVYVKPMDGPSNGHHEEKDEKKPEDKAESSEGKKRPQISFNCRSSHDRLEFPQERI